MKSNGRKRIRQLDYYQCVYIFKISQVNLLPYTADIVRHFKHYNEHTGSQFDRSSEY